MYSENGVLHNRSEVLSLIIYLYVCVWY